MDRITLYTLSKNLWHRYTFASALALVALWHLFPLLFLEKSPPAPPQPPPQGIALSFQSLNEWNREFNNGNGHPLLHQTPPSPSLSPLFFLSPNLLCDRSGKEASNKREELIKQLTLSPYESSTLSQVQHDASLIIRPLRGASSLSFSQLTLNDEIKQLLKGLTRDYYIVCEVTCLRRHGCLTWQLLEGELPTSAWQGALENLFQSMVFSMSNPAIEIDRIEVALFLSKARPAL